MLIMPAKPLRSTFRISVRLSISHGSLSRRRFHHGPRRTPGCAMYPEYGVPSGSSPQTSRYRSPRHAPSHGVCREGPQGILAACTSIDSKRRIDQGRKATRIADFGFWIGRDAKSNVKSAIGDGDQLCTRNSGVTMTGEKKPAAVLNSFIRACLRTFARWPKFHVTR